MMLCYLVVYREVLEFVNSESDIDSAPCVVVSAHMHNRFRTVCAWPIKMPVYQAVRQVGSRSARPSAACSHDNTWLCTQEQPDLWCSGPTLLPTGWPACAV